MPDSVSRDKEMFFALTPERILAAIELSGCRLSGRVLALNSYENRVMQAELEIRDKSQLKSRYDNFRVGKFYRPGRWSKEQILEEHRFTQQLKEEFVPVSMALELEDSSIISRIPDSEIFFCVYPRLGGRTLDELDDNKLLKIGRLIARLHQVGRREAAKHRLRLTADTYGRVPLEFLLTNDFVPEIIRSRYQTVVEAICQICDGLFKGHVYQRVHGDMHWGNVLWDGDECQLVDFDDMLMAPCIQDLWLLTPGRDEESYRCREVLLAGYEEMTEFNRAELYLVEGLRALRIINYAGWIAKRWDDPAFKSTFPSFMSLEFWRDQLIAVEEQLILLQGGSLD